MEWYLDLMVGTLKRAGMSFQKFGQWLSMRSFGGMLDQRVCAALGILRDDGPQHTFDHTRRLLEEACGCSLDAVFERLDEVPIASGSVAQVHRGRLRESFVNATIADHGSRFAEAFAGVDVAVKVLHPHVDAESWIDGELIFWCVSSLATLSKTWSAKAFSLPFGKETFLVSMRRQLDLRWEAYNLKRFQHNFKGDPVIQFPHVFASSSSILIMSWLPGQSVDKLYAPSTSSASTAPPSAPPTACASAGGRSAHVPQPASNCKSSCRVPPSVVTWAPAGLWPQGAAAAAAATAGEDEECRARGEKDERARTRKRLAQNIFDMTLKMYLRDNWVHGDLHSGNLLCTAVPGDDRVYVLDAGLTTALQPENTETFRYMLIAITQKNGPLVCNKMLRFNMGSDPVDSRALAAGRHSQKSSLPRWYIVTYVYIYIYIYIYI